MSQDKSKIPNQERVKEALSNAGFCRLHMHPLKQTLQGAIWSVRDKDGNSLIVKVTDRLLHETRCAESGNQTYRGIEENVVTEGKIMRYLCAQECPKSIVRYVSTFQSRHDYFLVMEKAGSQSLFDFAVKGHKLVEQGKLKLCEWRRVVRTIFAQMIEAIEFLHAHNCCHFDISLENFVINDLKIKEVKTLVARDQNVSCTSIEFMLDDVQCKLIDFGLSSLFVADQEKKDAVVSFKSSKVCGKHFYMAPELYKVNNGFDARANDVFGLGVCLWMLGLGTPPWHCAHSSDPLFVHMLNGRMTRVLRAWNKQDYVDENWVDLVSSMFQYESSRISLSAVKQHAWLKHKT